MMAGYAHTETLVDTQYAAAHAHDPNVRLVECDGNRKSYDAGHVEGAVFWNAYTDILRQDLRVEASPDAAAKLFARSGIANDTCVIIYSSSASAAALAFWYLKLFRHHDVRIIDGGRRKWASEQRPFTSEIPAIQPATYTPMEPDANIRALRADVEHSIGRGDHAFVDTRRSEEYSGKWFSSKPPEAGERGGHIAGAAHINFESALNPDGTFKSRDELRALYAAHGVTPDKEVTTYCTLGWRAGHTWFVLKYLLGYPHVKNYDASWNEWGRAEDTPIEA
jgi:thiosulfate/3-mercaptopyruvate sulfurtransferase